MFANRGLSKTCGGGAGLEENSRHIQLYKRLAARDAADGRAADAAGDERSSVSSGDGAHHHDHELGPVDHARPNKLEGGHAIDAGSEQRFQSVHLMDVGEAEDAERGQHQDAYAGAEVSAVEGDEELEKHGADEPAGRFVGFGMGDFQPALDGFLDHE